MTRHLLPLLTLAAFSMGCSLTPGKAMERMDEALRAAVKEDVKAAVMWVEAPKHGISRGFAHGVSNLEQKTPMTVDTPFLSASVGKLFIATAVMKLASQGRLALDASVARYVDREELKGLPVEGGDAAFDRITLAHLLSHRSGLPDYFSGASRDGAPRLFDRVTTEPERTWTRQDLLDYARAHYAPVGRPGETFAYSDTNYDLLGRVLEAVEGRPFHEVVRRHVLDALQLQHTFYHAFEPPPEGMADYADVWVGGVNLRNRKALSVDQAGGGLVTTVGDLRRFLRALVKGKPVPLSSFETDFTEDAMHPGIDVGRAAWRIRPRGIFFGLAGLPNLVGHSGATGVWAYYAAEWDAIFVGAVSDSRWQEKHIEFLLRHVLATLARTKAR